MSYFKARLSMEFSELSIRVEKLRDFILSDKFEALSPMDKDDLREQYGYMVKYINVLSRRVSRQCGNG